MLHDTAELMSAIHRGRVRVDAHTEAIALLLHGGRATEEQPNRLRDISYLRMLPFANTIRVVGRPGIAPVLVHNTHGGWVAQSGSGVVQARELVRALHEEFGLPIVLIGHSSGGWAALRAGVEASALGVVALAPWIADHEPTERLQDKVIRVIHGEEDTICSPVRAKAFVDEMRAQGADATFTGVPGGGHAMLDKPWRWHVRAARAVKEIVDSQKADRD